MKTELRVMSVAILLVVLTASSCQNQAAAGPAASADGVRPLAGRAAAAAAPAAAPAGFFVRFAPRE